MTWCATGATEVYHLRTACKNSDAHTAIITITPVPNTTHDAIE